MLASLEQLRSNARIEFDTSLLTDKGVQPLLQGVLELEARLGATEVFTCVCHNTRYPQALMQKVLTAMNRASCLIGRHSHTFSMVGRDSH